MDLRGCFCPRLFGCCWDLVEEFLATDIWPLSDGWAPTEIVMETVVWYHKPVPFPRFGLSLPEGTSAGPVVKGVERCAVEILGPFHINEYHATWKIVTHDHRMNRVFFEMGMEVEPQAKPHNPRNGCMILV